MLQAIQLSKRYEKDGPLALDELDLTVSAGEIFCLLGPNGAGKTTTINLFLGFIPATSGRAVVAGTDVALNPVEAKRRLAYVPENVAFYGNLTAYQNIAFFAGLADSGKVSRQTLVAALLKAGLAQEAIDRRVKEFSKGMRQKLGLATAFTKGAPAMLLDEPTSGLDPRSAHELMVTLQGLRDEGKAVLMSTHDVFRARGVADRVGIMNAGRMVRVMGREEFQKGDLEATYLRYAEGGS